MQCDLQIILPNQKKETLSELHELCEKDPNFSLREHIKGGKLDIKWPHTKPQPTGDVRAKLIHRRMRLQNAQAQRALPNDLRRAKVMNFVSTIVILIITVPLVAYSVYKISRWLGYSNNKSKQIGIIAGLISFFAELGLTVIQLYKEELRSKIKSRALNAKID
ncbi:hypothetical protein GPJ56_006191 [Histomonas meleagridis]|uniref:uncharacterized protein n=1 Tax=Histomonas meleagridis TaxID=135588 RepID=UPI003559A3C6|nr:hypothetical protein GPJ56_006191 [Histomonas meleagridis]KAH0796993.1 hypothetical protein GO595_010886 [Histomonas meleagridis]